MALDRERDDAYDAFDCVAAGDGSVRVPSLQSRASGSWEIHAPVQLW